jgi:hypothetical protein
MHKDPRRRNGGLPRSYRLRLFGISCDLTTWSTGTRTLYLAGDNTAWTTDERCIAALSSMKDLSLERFGYSSVMTHLDSTDVS